MGELGRLENIRSLTFRNVHIRCGECGVLIKWKNCGEVMRDLLKSFKHLEEFHFYDKVQRSEDITTIAKALTKVPCVSKLTLTDVNEEACRYLAQIETLRELHILVYKNVSSMELSRLRSVFEEYRELLPPCK